MKTKILSFILGVCIPGFASWMNPLNAQTMTGPVSPGLVTVVTIPGSASGFTDVYNCVFSDNMFVSNTGNLPVNGNYSDYLVVTDFGFSIPASATITGITVSVERTDLNGKSKDYRARIVKGGTIGTTDKSLASSWPITESIVTYGSPADLWSQTWTPTDINSSDFGFAFAIQRTGGGALSVLAKIDQITINISYNPGALPVVLSGISSWQNEDEVNISWTTESEMNIDYFTLQRMDPDQSKYIIANIRAMGDTLGGKDYVYVNAPAVEGNYRYTLFETDVAGNKTEIGNTSLYFDPQVGYSLSLPWENFKEHLPDIHIYSPVETNAELKIVDAKGNIVLENKLRLKEGKNMFDLHEMENSSAGVYFVLVFVKGKILHSRFLAN